MKVMHDIPAWILGIHHIPAQYEEQCVDSRFCMDLMRTSTMRTQETDGIALIKYEALTQD